jgi:Na+-transporting methylmalonyl-CoA/oxaloacetate decarboxylase gamma subunit
LTYLEELKLKGLQKKIIAGVIAAIGIVIAGLINYVVEHGELPAWSSGVLSWLSSLMLIQTPWAFWEILVIFLTPFVVLSLLIFYVWHMHAVLVDDYNEQYDKLRIAEAAKRKFENNHIELKTANAELLASVELLEVSNSDLVASNSDLTAQNGELKKEIDSLTLKAAPAELEVDDACLNVLKAIAALVERELRTSLDNVDAIVKYGRIKTEAAMDVLKDNGLISSAGSTQGIRYLFTPQGRAYYLKHKEL